MLAKKFILKNHLDGLPTLSNFELVEETIASELKDGEILLQSISHSVDPYQRAFASRLNVGDTPPGSQIATVLKSRNPRFAEGTKVIAYVGWRTLTVCNPDKMKGMFSAVLQLPDLPTGVPPSWCLGALGMTGLTAYFGLLKICQIKPGETVVISSGGGGVGSIAIQIAKIKGAKVIAFAGTDEKVKWIKQELGADFAFNYKEVSVDSILKKFAVEGVDVYFDNVGGEFTYNVQKNMSEFGRICLCGCSSMLNQDPKNNKVPFDYSVCIYKQLSMQGFLVNRYFTEWKDAIVQLAQWIQEGKIKVRETVTEGFENMPQAFIDLLIGKNIGKAIVTT